jgi:hypothetical protein
LNSGPPVPQTGAYRLMLQASLSFRDSAEITSGKRTYRNSYLQPSRLIKHRRWLVYRPFLLLLLVSVRMQAHTLNRAHRMERL